ncbi:hypothetical protein Q9L42_000050 (plasmid) [Methylomarinum sp. Ch1-1]|uniref:Uncharacterized protein n=1 Tax=Methylomarinum roseum TaxID=3067653 RepID=A0AAU7NPZ1_9GAMM|nr:hypothetical protein [Methylomarinum sp. Ch1-1]MDP4523103.1 hypothetical protein [Methylomarinum sp. Ch1-1]
MKFHFPGKTTCAVGLLNLCLLSACTPKTTIIHANFNTDSVGLPPASKPAGAPVNDSIYLDNSNVAHVIQSSEMKSKSLEIRDADGWVMFKPDQSLGNYNLIHVQWVGHQYLSGGYDQYPRMLIYLDLTGTLNPVMPRPVALMFMDGQIRTVGTDQIIGSYSKTENQIVSITVDMQKEMYQIALIPGFNSGWLPWHYDKSVVGEPDGLAVRMALGDGDSNSRYVMDDVIVEAK